jgi:hypothetical protein
MIQSHAIALEQYESASTMAIARAPTVRAWLARVAIVVATLSLHLNVAPSDAPQLYTNQSFVEDAIAAAAAVSDRLSIATSS